MPTPLMQPIISSWIEIGDLNSNLVGADAEEIAEAEEILDKKLPPEVKDLYELSKLGLSVLGGNLEIVPLLGPSDERRLVNYSDLLREWEWPIPNEFLAFGGNGCDDIFGIWIPKERTGITQPVVMLGEVFEPRCMAIVGTSICNFLRVWSSYYAYDCPRALDLLGVPQDLRDLEQDDELLAALYAWGDPLIPDNNPDCYNRGLTAEEVNRFCGNV